MNATQQIDDALDVASLQLPAPPRVIDLRWSFYEDWMGEDALKLVVVLADNTADDEIQGDWVHAVKWRIIDRLRQHDVTLFPYFFFARESDQNGVADQDAD